MPDSPTSESESTFVCARDELLIGLKDLGPLGAGVRSACAGEHFYQEHEGKRYCVLHFPGKEKSADFKKALQRKLENKDFYFRDVWFPDPLSFSNFGFGAQANFDGATFNADVDLSHATFSAKANFSHTTFSAEANFSHIAFSAEANFNHVAFSMEANFVFTTFSAEADFSSATFNAKADFLEAGFSAETSFREATFSQKAHFEGATFSAKADFSRAAISAKADFEGVTFSGEADFGSATFSGEADFGSATFSDQAHFERATFSAKADFGSATFSGEADFGSATFNVEADFGSATFGAKGTFSSATFSANTNFADATFSGEADFHSATFSAKAYFAGATFCGNAQFSFCTLNGKTDLSFVTFRDYVRFTGKKTTVMFSATSSLDLQFARIEKPEHLSFHSLSLWPHWFVNVDARQFEFINVKWHGSTAQEIKDLRSGYPYSAVHQLLAIAFRQLAVNAEDNHRYEEASRFRYMAMDVGRRERWRGFAFWRLDWWYWLASGYGERVLQAFLVLLGILLLGASVYNHVGFARWEPKLASETDVVTAKRDDMGTPLKFSRALTYSAGVMTLQKPDPRPATTAAQTVVLLETVLGPVQAALLALAIRRKFMR
jgi:hypothetical protein